jgi:hypothetical protein
MNGLEYTLPPCTDPDGLARGRAGLRRQNSNRIRVSVRAKARCFGKKVAYKRPPTKDTHRHRRVSEFSPPGLWSIYNLGKFAFGDRTIPIHARTLGKDVPARTRWACTTVQYSLQWCTLTRPPLVRTHTSNPAFPTGGGLGGFVFLACGGVGRRGRPRRGGWSHSSPVGKGGDVMLFCVLLRGWCVWGLFDVWCLRG